MSLLLFWKSIPGRAGFPLYLDEVLISPAPPPGVTLSTTRADDTMGGSAAGTSAVASDLARAETALILATDRPLTAAPLAGPSNPPPLIMEPE